MKKCINFIVGSLIIFLVLYLSKYILGVTKSSFPAPILGIIILFVLLKIGIIKEKYIEVFCKFILKHMILFFIPVFVGIMTYFDLISKNFLAIILTIFITTALVVVFVGVFVYNVIKFQRLYKIKNKEQK